MKNSIRQQFIARLQEIRNVSVAHVSLTAGTAQGSKLQHFSELEKEAGTGGAGGGQDTQQEESGIEASGRGDQPGSELDGGSGSGNNGEKSSAVVSYVKKLLGMESASRQAAAKRYLKVIRFIVLCCVLWILRVLVKNGYASGLGRSVARSRVVALFLKVVFDYKIDYKG